MAAGLVPDPVPSLPAPVPGSGRPLVIAHRGACGYRPEHTMAAYRLGVALGADVIEPDLVATRDGVLVARHENEISGTTDVAAHPEFAARRTTKVVSGRRQTGWFTEDFTLAELRTLRAVERLPALRPGSARYDGRFEVVTLDELLLWVAEESERVGRRIGVCAELKHATYFTGRGLPLEQLLLETLRDHALDHRGSGVVVESFETEPLRRLRETSDLVLVQLVDDHGAPADLVAVGDETTYADLAAPRGLRAIAGYADGVSLHRGLVLPRDPSTGETVGVTGIVDDAHAAGLSVLVYTVRDENAFLATDLRRGEDPAAPGDSFTETRLLLGAGVDGIFSDHPDTTVQVRADWLTGAAHSSSGGTLAR